ncbi:MAG TPA: hypothetical protein VKG25_26560, partial [Bryobacteraceae bacterium]|nr:hypothetical protein [Bryobacteraceae bacterium]
MYPFENPIGFGASDVVEFALAALLVSMVLLRPRIVPAFRRLASHPVLAMLTLAGLAATLRLVLLPHHPVPTPDIYDEFSHLLMADTLRHFRLANPPHPLAQFFETFFVLQDPTYSSIYPIGQGLMLAFGWNTFGYPWAGVLFCTAVMIAACYWMLRGWVSPDWALLGGLLALFEFGPLCLWMNDYWGGSFPALAGCLVFGALPRLRRQARWRDGWILGAGLFLHLITRPFESIFLLLAVALYIRRPFRPLLPALACTLAAFGLTVVQNKAVTGNWLTLPEALSQYQYGVPAALTFQPNPMPHRALTPQQQLEYQSQLAFRGSGPETLTTFLTRLEYRVRYYRFFFLAPLYVALTVFLISGRQYWIMASLALFALGTNFFPAFQFHYVAAATCLFVLASVIGLEKMPRPAAHIVFFLCAAHFAFWYALHLADDQPFSLAMRRYETGDYINHQNPERRIAVGQALARIPDKLLILVRYWPQHVFQEEWVYNAADIHRARIVWARDLGDAEDEKLKQLYPDRTVLLLEPDAQPPKLSPYEPA